MSPHEQTQRAGCVLWITLQNELGDVRATNVLLSLKGNLSYNQNYRSVFVSILDTTNQFIEKKENVLDQDPNCNRTCKEFEAKKPNDGTACGQGQKRCQMCETWANYADACWPS